MKITKSELKEMIRECLREELNTRNVTLAEGAMSGGYAENGSLDTYARPGGSTQPSKKSYLNRLKFKNPDLVDIMTVKGKDIKPGMITQAGQVKEATTKYSWQHNGDAVYIMHTNNYDGFWGTDEDMEVLVDPDNKSKPFTGKYEDLLDKGLKEAASGKAEETLAEDVNTMSWEDLIAAADGLLDELITVTGNDAYDDGDGYWSGEEGHIWCNRYMYYTDKLNSSADLERLCAEYSSKLPNVVFYYTEDDFFGDAVSEIGYEATNVDYVED